MRDSCIPAHSVTRTPRTPHAPAELSHVGILRLIDRFGTESLRDWLTLRCFVEAARLDPGGAPIAPDAIVRWAAHGLCDRRGAPLLPEHTTFESRYLLAQFTAALTARGGTPSSLHDAVATRVRCNFLAAPERSAVRASTPETLDAVLRALTAAFRQLGGQCPDAGPCLAVTPRPAPDLNGIDETRNPAELFDAWDAALRRAGDGPPALPTGPVDIVSKIRHGDLRVVRERPTDIRARLEVTFPTQPPRTIEAPLPPSLARCLPAFCNPLGPLEHDALKAALRHIPACRATLDDDDRRARLYWSAAARYAHAPSRRGAHRRSRPWRATVLRAMVLTASWSGEAPSRTRPENPGPRAVSSAWAASPWAACQRWLHAAALPFAMAHAATLGDAGFLTADRMDKVDMADGAGETDAADESAESDGADETEGNDGADDSVNSDTPAGTDDPEQLMSSAKTWDDDEVTLIWAHVSPGVRRRIVAGARRFAGYSPVLDGSEGPRDDDAIQRLNHEGWYAYSNIPAIFFICDKLLDDRQVLNQTALHALLGDIGRAAVRDRANYVLCFEDQRNRSLAWRVDTTAAPGTDVTPLALAPVNLRDASATGSAADASRNASADAASDASDAPDAPDAPDASDAIRKASGNRLVLKQILALLAKTNDPPFNLDTLLCTMIEVKHGYDADIARHARRSVAEIRMAIRRVALERLIDINRRGFPRRHASPDDITTTGANRFVDLLLGLLDPVLQGAPDALAYGGAEMFHARFGHYFAERNGKPGVAPGRWTPIVSRGREYVKGWCVLTRDENYLAAMRRENPALIRHLQSLFANDIARSAWLFHMLREGPPLARSTIAKQFLLDAGIPPEHRIELRKFITLNEAQTQHSLLRAFDNGTFLEVYMAIDNGLERLREAEPRYLSVLSNRALDHLPSRREVIDQYDKAFDDKVRNILRFSRDTIQTSFATAPAAIRQDFATAARLRLHLYRPLANETSLIAQYVGPLEGDAHRYQRKVLGHSTGAIIETIGTSGQSRFYLFDMEHFLIGNRTAILTALPALNSSRHVGDYMASRPDQFFVERFPSIYDEPVYYKNDVTPHLQFECGGLGGIWTKWIDFRVSHQAWQKRALREQIGVEKIQDDPFTPYLEMLPFYPCESARKARALTLQVLLDSIFCLVDLSGLRHVLRPMRTWIAHSAVVGVIEKKLAWYESLKKRPSLDSQIINGQMQALRAAQRSVEELRQRRSTHEVAIAFRKIGHFPYRGPAASTGYRLYQATQSMLEIAVRARPFADDSRESPMQRLLRWRNRYKLWETGTRSEPLAQQPPPGRKTIVGELRHADEQALPYRLREPTCSPNVCISACLFDSLASMTTRRRLRIFIKLLDGVPPHSVVRQSVRQGFLLTSNVLRELTQLETDLAPLRAKFTAVRQSDFAPASRRREILNQALLHPYAKRAAHLRLQASPTYRELADDLHVLNFFYESPLQQLVQTLDLQREPGRSCRAPATNETTPGTHNPASSPGPDAQAAAIPAATPDAPPTASTVTPPERDEACTRPGEDNEIRTCLLPITPCADQRALPAASFDADGRSGTTSG
ncbi:MAG: hypothetical protein ACRYHA_00645 [Janthinobacterium lividum]